VLNQSVNWGKVVCLGVRQGRHRRATTLDGTRHSQSIRVSEQASKQASTRLYASVDMDVDIDDDVVLTTEDNLSPIYELVNTLSLTTNTNTNTNAYMPKAYSSPARRGKRPFPNLRTGLTLYH